MPCQRVGLLAGVCAALLIGSQPAQALNSLGEHPSPYLAMHAEDPVHWREWGPEALDAARRENRLLFVSSGYYSCYWCHVMQRESFVDEAVARRLNGFVPIKIDRELLPGLDAFLLEFVRRSRGQAGWPLNVLLTPDGYPLLGFVYLPRDRFVSLLDGVQRAWAEDRRELTRSAEADFAAARAGATSAVAKPGLPADAAATAMGAFLEDAMATADHLAGGFGDQAKFPLVPRLAALLQGLAWRPDGEAEAFLRLTLDQMADRGLRDHLGGGFFRYCTDPTWQAPHFEKMLYDNALLADLYLQAGRVLRQPRYTALARETLDFMLAEMRHPEGGLIAALSAVDESGEDGGYYLWTEAQIARLVDAADREIARQAWPLGAAGEFAAGALPVPGASDAAIGARLGATPAVVAAARQRIRARLLEARRDRSLPRDEKRISAWNALALSALLKGYAETGHKRYLEAAAELRTFLLGQLGPDGRLARARVGDKALGAATLSDFAYVGRALLDWSLAVDSPADRDSAAGLVRRAWQRFAAPAGWQLLDDDALPYELREAALPDGPMPSPSALLAEMSLALGRSAEHRDLAARGAVALAVAWEAVGARPAVHGTAARVLQQRCSNAVDCVAPGR